MNALTVNAIQKIGQQIQDDLVHYLHPDLVYYMTTITYVQSLLQPYAQEIEQAITIDGIRHWIRARFPGRLTDRAIAELDRVARTGSLEAVKVAVIEYIVAEILELAGNTVKDDDDTILPWDIQKAIGFNPELSALTGIRNDPQTLRNGEPRLLPVVINEYTHYLSLDFVAGLLLFSVRYGQDFGVMMFGAAFSPNYMMEETRYTAGRLTQYKVTIIDTDFDFDSPEFMQGFATGALWANVDHHNYWTALYQAAENGDMIEITF